MANAIIGGLGKLLQMGAAYLRHAQAARGAARLAPAQMKAELSAYLNGLTAKEFSGFKLSVAAEALREKDQTLKQALSWIASNAEALRDGAASLEAPAASVKAAPVAPAAPPAREATFDEVLAMLNGWWGVEWPEVEKQLLGHVDSLDERGFAGFIAHIDEARGNIQANLEQTKNNEANAWGGFVEDRMAYLWAKAKTGGRDPEFDRRIRELETSAAFVERIRNTAHERRRWLDEQARVRAQQQQARQAEKRSQQSSFAEKTTGLDTNALFAQLESLRQSALAKGELRPERDYGTRAWLDEFKNVLQAKESGKMSGEEAIAAVQRIAAKRKDMIVDAGPDPASKLPEESRAAALVPRLQAIKEFAMSAGMKAPSGQTYDAVMGLFSHAARALSELPKLSDDAQTLGFEQTEIRPLAQEATQLALLPHALVAFPAWDCPDADPSANAVFFSGDADLGDILKDVLRTKRMQLQPRRKGNYGQSRWDQLRSSFVTIFDWRCYERDLIQRSPDAAANLAATAYELGLALTLGKPVVIVADEKREMPFDIDIDPVRLAGDKAADAELLAEAIDDAMYGFQRLSDQSNLSLTLEQLSKLAAATTRPKVIEGMGWLDPEKVRDPVGFHAAARQVVREAGRGEIITPVWTSNRRASDDTTLFHVTPFSLEWSGAARDAVRAACGQAGIRHTDGETARDARILQRIWDGIAGADWVLVDVTDLNFNVLIELGMAHALGRPTQIVQRVRGPEYKPPQIRNLEKIEIRGYRDFAGLRKLICDWVGSGS